MDPHGSPVQIGEFQGLGSSPFWDVDGLWSNGDRTVDFTGTDNDGTLGRLLYEAPEGLRPPLGPAERHGGRGPGYTASQRPMARSLAKRPRHRHLRPPGSFVTHEAIHFLAGAR